MAAPHVPYQLFEFYVAGADGFGYRVCHRTGGTIYRSATSADARDLCYRLNRAFTEWVEQGAGTFAQCDQSYGGTE